MLQMARPRDLPGMQPVPGNDEEVRREVENVHEEGGSRRDGRSRSSRPGRRPQP